MPTIVAFTGFEFGTEAGIGVGLFDGATGVAGTDYKVVAGTPVVGSYVGQIATLNNKNFFWNTTTLGGTSTSLVVSLRFMFSTLPTSANDFHSIDTAAGTDRAGFYYDPADQKVHAWILSATQAATSTIVANTWYTLQFRYSCSANPNTLDWTFNGTAQTSVSNGSAGATTLTRYALGNRGGATGVVNFDDTAVSVTSGDYPLPMYQVRLIGVDTAGSTSQIGTANATVRFTANGTLDGAHSSSAILTALSELPPLLGATSSGVAQQTAGAGNAVEVPMATYTLTGGEAIAYTRIYVAGWAASALAANLGLRAWNGTAETILHGDTVATGFDNTTAGAWYAALYTGVTDQTTLNALTVRLGYSTDVSPVIGAHAVYAELLILPGAGGTTLVDAAGGGAASGGTAETITTVLVDAAGGGAASGTSGPESSTVALLDLAGGGAGAGGVRPESIATVLNDAAGGGAASGESGPETAGGSLSDLPGGGAASGGTSETITTALADLAGGGAGAGGTANGTTVALTDAAGGGSGAGGTPPEGSTVALNDAAGGGAGAGSSTGTVTTALADLAGGGAAAGTSTETFTSGGGVAVSLNDLPGGGAVSGGTIETPASSELEHDPMIMPILSAMLSCLTSLEPIWPNAPAAYQLRSGNTFVASADSAMDECCSGIAWVRMGPSYPTDDFPIQKTTVENGTETDWAISVEIGVQRCIPTQGDDGVMGSVVTGAQHLAAVQQEADDAYMLRLAACCLRDGYTYTNGQKMGNSGMIIGVQTPLENSGPCGGIMLLVTVRAPACDCPTM